MISSKRSKPPKASLDDFLDELISNPTEVDLQLIGDVQADKSKSSRMIKGQAELIELNAWIDRHNKHPSVDSADFKESQLARRMNGYAFKPAEHEELKPFDKHNLINAALYQKPTSSVALEGWHATAGEGDAVGGAVTFSPVAQPISLLAGIDELPLFDSETPLSSDDESLSSPATKAAAQAILRLRNRQNQQSTSHEQNRLESDDFTLTDNAAPELPLTASDAPDSHSPTDDAPTSLESPDKPLEPAVEPIADSTSTEQSSEASTQDQDDATVVVTSYVDTEIGEHASTSPSITASIVEVEDDTQPERLGLSYLDITFNPPAKAIAYDDIGYVRKPALATAGETEAYDHTIATDPADEIKQVFSSVPSPDEIPANYQDKDDDAAFSDDSYGNSYNPFGFTEYDDGYFEGRSTPTGTKAVVPDVEVSNASDTVTPASTSPAPDAKPNLKREWYWSIDGEIDPNVVNSDAATGLTQRHNPNAPMFKDTARTPNPNTGSDTNDDTNADAKPATKPPRERIGLNRTKAAGDKPRSNPSRDDTSATEPETEVLTETVSIEHLLSADVAAGVKKVAEKLDAPVKKFGSIDDILDDDLDFLESLTADEDQYFDIDNNFAMTGAGMKNAPDEIGKQTPCQDFYMYESHFRNLHARLESGDLKTIRHTATNLNQGDAFILDGMVGFIQSMGEERVGSRGRHDPRLRLVFDNKTESNILLSTLNKRLYTDQNGRRIIPSADDFADFDTPKAKAKVRTGQIYIVRTLSSNPKLRQIPNLYKIGFTKSTVEERTKNATRDIAFLESPVEVMLKADCFDTDPRGLESLIHGFLHHQRINITLTGKNGGKYHPQEWFSISLEEAKKVISAIVDHSIIDYRMDNTTNRMVKKSL